MNRLILIILILSYHLGWAQENLVPNPSFEILDSCPTGPMQLWLTESWVNVYGGNDYFHECGSNGFGVPVSSWGGGYANSGQAYSDISLWAKAFLGREFLGVELMDTLIPGKRYNVEFYISFVDSFWYAVKNIGIYFSQGQPPESVSTLLSYEPQVKYEGIGFLTEKEGWTKIEGGFIAQGGETFITIGNFDNDTETDTSFVSGGGIENPDIPGYWDAAGYFIDDVSVRVDTTIGMDELEKLKFNVYPNPAKGAITVEIEQTHEKPILQLVDITGRIIFSVSLSSTKTLINLSAISQGIYTALLLQNDAVISRKKIVIE